MTVQAKDRAVRRTKRLAALCLKYGAIACVCLVLAVAGLLALAASGVGKGRLEVAARAALSEAAGADVAARFADARLVMSRSSLFGVEFRDVHLSTGSDEDRRLQVDRMRFGLDLRQLLGGRLRLSDASLSGVEIFWNGDGPPLSERIRDARGLIDPDRVVREAMTFIERVAQTARVRFGGAVEAEAIQVEFLESFPGFDLILEHSLAARDADGRLTLSMAGAVLGVPFRLDSRIWNEEGSKHVEATIDLDTMHWQSRILKDGEPAFTFDGGAHVELSARRDAADGLSYIDTRLRLDDFVIGTAEGERQRASTIVDMTLAEGTGKVEINQLLVRAGRTALNFHGAVSPVPEGHPVVAYRYELVSDGSRIAPDASPEASLSILARVAGILDPDAGRFTADEIKVRTSHGDVIGNGAMVFTGEGSPALFLAISAAGLPVSHAKQLWPWKAADGARRWVHANVFGGTVERAEIELSVVAGRIGDGIPFGPDEISGHFVIRDTRFDMAGELPPVRDASGRVDFRGRQVEIALEQGTVYLPSGRTVAGRNGRMAIHVVKGEPLLGELSVEVSGTADAVTEFAILEPISVGRFVELTPDDFSGDVEGTVSGVIPLEKKVDPDLVSWEVSLSYDALNIAKPFDGHMLSNASGTLFVDRQSAVIEARGLLNGLPAHFSVVEPLLGSSVSARRDIRLELDDKSLARVAPGLSAIVSGRLSVAVDDEAGSKRKVRADLTNAVLSIPWAGWRKGAGIPAEASFVMTGENNALSLSDLTISGDGFRIAGAATLSGGRIAKAVFDRVELNRGDRFRLQIDRHNGGYKLDIHGEQIDARSIIRQVLAEPEAAKTGLEDMPIWLSARSSSLTGFGNEKLSDVTINYVGRGSRILGLSLSAVTGRGGRFTVRAEESEGRRSVQMQSVDAGAILRFLDIYQYMQGGSIDLRLAGKVDGPLRGQVDARDFWLVNDPRLRSLLTSAPEPHRSGGAGNSGNIDVSRARFERGFARLEKGDNYLNIADGVLRGVEIGSTFQGTLYDPAGQMSITGTFMPAYGLNSMFAQIPIFGVLLGNGRDRGLIGITYKLSGDAKAPRLAINPISAIAPGIFRSIFEFR